MQSVCLEEGILDSCVNSTHLLIYCILMGAGVGSGMIAGSTERTKGTESLSMAGLNQKETDHGGLNKG